MILCCGEALIDMLPRTLPGGGIAYAPHAGGSVFNTAIGLGRLGNGVGFLSGVSRDMFGDQLRAELAASGVEGDHVILSDRPTTLAFVTLTDGQARYHFMDENSAGRMIAPADLPTVGESVSALYFGGISLACEPGAETYATLQAAEGAGRAVMLDPNIRPDFIRDPTRFRDRMARMVARADIVKISDEDLAWLDPDGSEATRVSRMQASGPALIIVTRGAQGATGYMRSGGQVTVPAPRVEVVDTVGAGDTFNSGLLHALDRRGGLSPQGIASLSQDHLAEALTLGARVAAITVSRAGANPPWAAELD
ncbi:carbohydrate kinase family protein [Pseudooceanicola aestuarii]|uniref:carbohydrate kinase family protein n=1 Tax=Pseudooceanicola aestuarii TaxID=2697319 RepID=UPI0013D74B5D|nr:carbohydrate kinase [Pseudooceanicola aestuarii]